MWWLEQCDDRTLPARLTEGQRILGLTFPLDRLLEFQRRYQAIEGIRKAPEVFCIFQDVWQQLARLEPAHPLFVPPIYLSDELKTLLEAIIERIRRCETNESWSQEKLYSALQAIGGGNFLLGGVKGVGKTTFLRAVALAVAITSPNYLLVFIDLARERIRGVSDVLKRVFVQVRELHGLLANASAAARRSFPLLPFARTPVAHVPEGLTCSSMARGFEGLPRCGIGIVLDEVQRLEFEPGRAREFLDDIESYAQYDSLATVIVSGSSLRVREIVGMANGVSTISRWSSHVAKFYYVPATRCPADLQQYLALRYPHDHVMHSLDEETLRTLLHVTGGIGRHHAV